MSTRPTPAFTLCMLRAPKERARHEAKRQQEKIVSSPLKSNVVTRFAPSPTGYLHIGGARTALFNWAFARHHGGKFLLRIEDTDRERSTQDATNAIFDGLSWLGLEHDDDAVFQHKNIDRHVAISKELLASNHAYACSCSAEDVAAMREAARARGETPRYDGTCRDKALNFVEGKTVIRFKAPQDGETIVNDCVQGRITLQNNQLDDLIILRSDGSPTYMLSVVVDDHDMEVTHVIRGDDHMTNSFRQMQIYQALNWPIPEFAHIPLIHGSDGAKLSKRHGALGVDAYRDLGMLPEAMRNYLSRLGWSHGDDELFSTQELVAWFSLDGIGKAPARFDLDKLMHVNGHHLRLASDDLLFDEICKRRPSAVDVESEILRGLASLKERAQTLDQLAENCDFIISGRPVNINEKAQSMMTPPRMENLAKLLPILQTITPWTSEACESAIKAFLETEDIGLGQVGPALRAALTGTPNSPGIYDILNILGQAEAVDRVRDQLKMNGLVI